MPDEREMDGHSTASMASGRPAAPAHAREAGSAADHVTAAGSHSGLAETIIRAAGRGPAPVHLWNPPYCGEMDLVIRADGSWIHDGSPIGREAMVRLFASVLKREGGRFYLVTPVEKLGIRVEDAPFVAVDAEIGGGRAVFVTNLGERVEAGPDHPVRVEVAPDGTPRPYVHVRGTPGPEAGLEALIDRKTFYRLVDAARQDGDGRLVLDARGAAFRLDGTDLPAGGG